MKASVLSKLSYREELSFEYLRVLLYVLLVTFFSLYQLLQKPFFNFDLMLYSYSCLAVGFSLRATVLWSPDFFIKQKVFIFFTYLIDIAVFTFLFAKAQLSLTLMLVSYLILVLSIGLYFRKNITLILTALASLSLSYIAYKNPQLIGFEYYLIFILNNVALVGVAWFSGELREKLLYSQEELESTQLSKTALQKLSDFLLDQSPVGLMTLNSDGEVLTANHACAKLFATSDLVGKNVQALEPYLEFSDLKTKDRSEIVSSQKRWLEVQVKKGEEGLFKHSPWIMTLQDLTEVKNLQQTLRDREKLAAVGRLAAGIAHEIRNPLAGISGSVEMLSTTAANADDQKLFKIILREIDRLNRLITEFLDYSRPMEVLPSTPICLSDLLIEVIEAQKAIARDKPIHWKIEIQDKYFIHGDADKLRQVFINFLVNSTQALSQVDAPEIAVSVWPVPKENLVKVSVRDNGIGMSQETQEKVFEPFFTTKPKGTGLGLAITHQILQAHKAQTELKSEIGQGSEFIICFPLVNSLKL